MDCTLWREGVLLGRATVESMPGAPRAFWLGRMQPHEGFSSEGDDLETHNPTLETPEARLVGDAMHRIAGLGLEVRAESGVRIETEGIQVARFPIEALLPTEARAALPFLSIDVCPRMMTITLAAGGGDAA